MWFRNIFLPDKKRQTTVRKAPLSSDEYSLGISPNVFRQLDRLQIRGSRELRGDRMGQRSSHRRKPSADFVEHRRYVAGDDIRFVDWRTSARHEGVFVRQGELQKDVVVYLLIDCSASMKWGEPAKAWLQKKLALALGYLALSQGDRLYVQPYGGSGNPDFGPASGKGQLNALMRYLNKLNYGGEASLATGIAGLKKKISRGGILFILSDLLERGNIGDILNSLPAPVWWVNIIHLLHPAEVQPSLRGQMELVDVETGLRANYDLNNEAITSYLFRVKQWQNSLELACAENHAFYTMLQTDSSLEKEVLPILRSVKVLVDQ